MSILPGHWELFQHLLLKTSPDAFMPENSSCRHVPTEMHGALWSQRLWGGQGKEVSPGDGGRVLALFVQGRGVPTYTREI